MVSSIIMITIIFIIVIITSWQVFAAILWEDYCITV